VADFRTSLTNFRQGTSRLSKQVGEAQSTPKPEMVSTQDKIRLTPTRTKHLSKGQQLRNLGSGILADTKHLTHSIRYKIPVLIAKLRNKPTPKIPKSEPYQFKNPFSTRYRKLKYRVRTADRRVQAAQRNIPTKVSTKTKKRFGLFYRLNQHLRRSESKISRYVMKKKSTRESSVNRKIRKTRRP